MINLQQRIDRLSEITAGQELLKNYPMLKAVDLPLRGALMASVNRYLIDTVYAATGDIIHQSAFGHYKGKLPNVTPNGIILPKRDTWLAYNRVHAALADTVKALNITQHIELIQSPITIRLVDGAVTDTNKRPRASTKAHTDIWAGEPSSTIQCSMIVGGDWTSATVRYMQPTVFPEELVCPLADYHEGASVLKECEHYDCFLDQSGLFIMDSFLIHQTLKLNPGFRVSIDFRFIPKQKLDSDNYNTDFRAANYVPFETWAGYGRDRVLVTDLPMVAFTGKDEVKNEYATPFRTVETKQ